MSSAAPNPAVQVARDFQILRRNLAETRFAACRPPSATELHAGEILLAVDKFAFGPSNLGYVRGGGAPVYLSFFPAPEGWGRLPVWGYAEVAASRHPEVREGERLFGYVPMSTHLRLAAGACDAAGFSDVSSHRVRLPPAYNRFLRVLRDPGYFPARENEQALLRPQFATSFLIDDHLGEQDLFGAERILISSASSKTAQALGFLLRQRRFAQVVGLTSASNLAYCQRSGCFDSLISYDRLSTLPLAGAAVYVDLGGDGGLCSAVHRLLGLRLRASIRVAASSEASLPELPELPGPLPQLFVAPLRLRQRMAQWGGEQFEERHGAAWRSFALSLSGWLRIQHQRGEAAVDRVYAEILGGRASADVGHILSL